MDTARRKGFGFGRLADELERPDVARFGAWEASAEGWRGAGGLECGRLVAAIDALAREPKERVGEGGGVGVDRGAGRREDQWWRGRRKQEAGRDRRRAIYISGSSLFVLVLGQELLIQLVDI